MESKKIAEIRITVVAEDNERKSAWGIELINDESLCLADVGILNTMLDEIKSMLLRKFTQLEMDSGDRRVSYG